MPIGALIGAPLAGWLVDYIGRKKSLLLCSVPFATGWIITIVSHASAHATVVRVLLFAGRFFVGIGVGSASLCVPVSQQCCIKLPPLKYWHSKYLLQNSFYIMSIILLCTNRLDHN